MRDETERVVAPVKALRLTDMIDALVREGRAEPLDGVARTHLLTLYQATLIEVGSILSDALLDELWRMQTRGLSDAATFDELRVAMTQLEDSLQGVLRGVLAGTTSVDVEESEQDIASAG